MAVHIVKDKALLLRDHLHGMDRSGKAAADRDSEDALIPFCFQLFKQLLDLSHRRQRGAQHRTLAHPLIDLIDGDVDRI